MTITFTDLARDKALQFRKEENMEPHPLRLGVLGGGCSGFSYNLFFDADGQKDTDEVFTFGDLVVLVDPMSMSYLDGTTVDFVQTTLQSGFKFANPNSTGNCGCGSSFSA